MEYENFKTITRKPVNDKLKIWDIYTLRMNVKFDFT